MKNTYDRIAPIYDRLARIVFGRSQIEAQIFLVEFILPRTKVLIAGGGTGLILEEIARFHSSGIEITYIEKSARMIALAAKRNWKENKVHFIHSDIADYSGIKMFDVILTAFLFDNFDQSFAYQIFAKLDALLSQNGLWLYADFEVGRESSVANKSIIKLMYWFFAIVSKVQAVKLPDMNPYFYSGYHCLERKSYYGDFIVSIAYKKAANLKL